MSKIQVNEIVDHFDTGAPDFPRGLVVSHTGVSTFTGDVNFDGDVGIGTDNPDSILEIRDFFSRGLIIRADSTQATNTNKAIRIRNNSDTDTFTLSHRGQGIFSSEGVGIGTDNPADPLSIGGTIRVQNSTDSTQYLTINHQGIDFQNTGAGSSTTATAHLLDDYEEGTFTPMYWAGTGGIITQSTINTGHYNKVGNICWINIRIATTEASAFTGYSGQIRIESLPFASAGGDRVGALAIGEMWRWESTADTEFTKARVNSGGMTSINLVNNNESAGSESVLDVVDLDLGTNRNILNVSGWYRVA